MDLKSMIGWFSLLLAAACAMVGLIALYAIATGRTPDAPGTDNLMLPVAMLFLSPIGLATMAAGAVGLFWPSEHDAEGHTFRCWLALVVGVLAAACSFMFGPNV